MSMFPGVIDCFEEGWDFMQKCIKKFIEALPNNPTNLDVEDCSMMYTNVYNMCSQKPPYNYPDQLYEKYKETFEEYIKSTVLPSLQGKREEHLLREVIERWSNQKYMTRFLSNRFGYLDKHYIPSLMLPSLAETGYLSFYSLVYDEMSREIMDAISVMIARKHAGKFIDETLVNNALTFFSEIGEILRKDEPKHFAETMTANMQGASN